MLFYYQLEIKIIFNNLKLQILKKKNLFDLKIQFIYFYKCSVKNNNIVNHNF